MAECGSAGGNAIVQNRGGREAAAEGAENDIGRPAPRRARMPGDERRPALVERLDDGIARSRHVDGLAADNDAVFALAGARQPDAATDHFELAAAAAERHHAAGREAPRRRTEKRRKVAELLRIHH